MEAMAVPFERAARPAGRRGLRWLKGIGRFAREQPLGLASALIILVILFAGVFAVWVAPYDPLATDFAKLLLPPDATHWAGTDEFGRDIFSRLVYGARTALILGICSSLLGGIAGGLLGVTSAYFGGWVDTVLQRFVDILLSLPVIILALIVAAVLGRHEIYGIDANLMFAVAIPYMPKAARVIRAAALTVRTMPYIDAARAAGFSHPRIVLGHMAPNLAAPWLVLVSAFTAQTILLEAALSYLGVGVTDPTPSWGLMLSGVAVQSFSQAPWTVIFPGLAISLTVFAFSLLGDALRDTLDPKFRH
ncbi:ABC transporter permease [Aromatoleum toluclasticum]|uniref:ABC transporter permease n=1 Tax=Aromatoleum toluclasticum TaxID=92003 RepID=UPI0003820DE5|nr:ABC transporter permease [Aromatoleum toluclasticum]